MDRVSSPGLSARFSSEPPQHIAPMELDENQARRARRIDFWLFVSVWMAVFAAGIAILLQSKRDSTRLRVNFAAARIRVIRARFQRVHYGDT
jgi:hypothetical protein